MAKSGVKKFPEKSHDVRYKKLIENLSALLQETAKTGSQALNQTRIDSYWHMGRRLKSFRERTDKLIGRLARDLRVERNVLYRAHNFFETWQDGLTRDARKLAWRLHVILNGTKNVRVRDFYVATALARGWNDTKLRDALKNDLFENLHNTPDDTNLKRDVDPLNVYKAHVESVIDGDTIEVNIDLGFETWTKKKSMRLRGINASELDKPSRPSNNTQLADSAKAFIVKRLKGVPFVVVKTYKTDIYGRYIADLFYHPKFTDKRDVVKKGFFLNEELLKENLVLRSFES